MAAFRYVLGQYAPGNRPAVWAAWGTLIEKRPYLFDALEEMLAIGEEFITKIMNITVIGNITIPQTYQILPQYL